MEVEQPASSSAMDEDAGQNKKQRVRTEQVASLPWVEKYRPKSMEELVSHEDIINTINRLIDAGKLPHLMLYGPPGTGKTSTILACAHKLYGKGFTSMVLELNASDDRGIDVVRNKIKMFAQKKVTLPPGRHKVVVLDEADSMTAASLFFNAFLGAGRMSDYEVLPRPWCGG